MIPKNFEGELMTCLWLAKRLPIHARTSLIIVSRFFYLIFSERIVGASRKDIADRARASGDGEDACRRHVSRCVPMHTSVGLKKKSHDANGTRRLTIASIIASCRCTGIGTTYAHTNTMILHSNT